jgi:hypothetical protein
MVVCCDVLYRGEMCCAVTWSAVENILSLAVGVVL